jgi:hypothetical protein
MKSNKSKKEEFIKMDMPEVKDIPGQEHVRPPHMKEMSDVTASSDDEEGKGLLDDLNKEDDDDTLDDNDNVTDLEKELLEESDRPVTEETKDLRKLNLDPIDDDDQDMNEKDNPMDMGEDLDVPGSELDDDDEELGEEDEENNSYSQRD